MTMTELAKLAGVSQSTVSLVLNQKEGRRIHPDTEKRILQIADSHNFRVNHAAVALRKRSTSTIGIVMVTPYFPVYAEKATFLQQMLQTRGFRPLFSFYSSLDKLEGTIKNLLEYQVDGIISWDYHPLFDQEKRPIVIYETAHPDYDAVLIDGRNYAEQVIALARRFHHHDIIYLGAFNNSRAEELKKYAAEKGIQIEFINSSNPLEYACEQAKKILRRKSIPSLFLCNDYYTNAVYAAAYDLGIRIPEDISVIGNSFKDIMFMRPALTTLNLNLALSCENLVDLLIRRIRNPEKQVEHIKVPTTIILRDSVAERRNWR